MKQKRQTSARAKLRWWLWWPLLAASAWLAWFGDKSPQGSAQPSFPTRAMAPGPNPEAVPATESKPTTDEHALLALIPRDQLFPAPSEKPPNPIPERRELFSAHNWNPPPPVAPVEKPAPPVAPPVPYNVIGKKYEGDRWELYLERQDQIFVVREGQTVEGSYRVERIQPPLATLTYLPLGQSQTLSIGDSR